MTEQEWIDNFTHALKVKMRNRRVDQKELARRANISEVSMCRYKKGLRVPPAHILVNLANGLECSIDELANFGEIVE